MIRQAKNLVKGFKVLDLMIVAAATSLCVILGVPAHSKYAVRTKLSEALTMAQEAKTAISITCAENPSLASLDNQAVGFTAHETEFVTDVTVDGPCANPAIHVATANTGAAVDPTLTITGVYEVKTHRLTWTCKSDGPDGQLPRTCRTEEN